MCVSRAASKGRDEEKEEEEEEEREGEGEIVRGRQGTRSI